MNETDRLNKIDARADWKLRQGDDRPATEVWDEAEAEIDAAERLRKINARSCAIILGRDGRN